MPHSKLLVLLLLFSGYTVSASGQTEIYGHGGKETLSHLQGIIVHVEPDGEPSDKYEEIAKKLRENVVIPVLEDAGIRVYSLKEGVSTDSRAELSVKFLVNFSSGVYRVQPIKLRQYVQTHGGAELRCITYSRSAAAEGISTNPYPALSGGIRQVMRAFTQDWHAVH